MNQNEKRLWMKALEGSGKAYRKLGLLYLREGRGGKNRRLGKLCLKHAAEMGDEKGFQIYHRLFSKGRRVIDDRSYQEMWEEYQKAEAGKEKKVLEGYLRLGTERQRKRAKSSGMSGSMSGRHYITEADYKKMRENVGK